MVVEIAVVKWWWLQQQQWCGKIVVAAMTMTMEVVEWWQQQWWWLWWQWQCGCSGGEKCDVQWWWNGGGDNGCNDPSHRYDITTLKCNISILSKNSINLIMKTRVNFLRYTFTKQHTNKRTNTYILNHYTSFTCQNIIQFLHVSKPGIYTPNKKNKGTN